MTSVAERIAALKKKEKSGPPPLIRAKSSKASFAAQKTSPKVTNASVTGGVAHRRKAGDSAKETKEPVKERPVDIATDGQKPVSSVKDRIRQLQLQQQQGKAKATPSPTPSDAKPKLKPRPITGEKRVPSASQRNLAGGDKKASLQESAGESPPIPARPKGVSRAKSARYPGLSVSKSTTGPGAISKSKSLGHEASKAMFEKDKTGEQIFKVHVAKKTSKKIAQLAVNIPLPGMAPKLPQRPMAQPSPAADGEHNGEIKHLSMSRPKMAAGRRRRPRGIKTVARHAVGVEGRSSTSTTSATNGKKQEKEAKSDVVSEGKEEVKSKEEAKAKDAEDNVKDADADTKEVDEDDVEAEDEAASGKKEKGEIAAKEAEEITDGDGLEQASKRAKADDGSDGERGGACGGNDEDNGKAEEATASDTELSGASVQTGGDDAKEEDSVDEDDIMEEQEDADDEAK